jgi:exodeoxyribonuclease VII large subunit
VQGEGAGPDIARAIHLLNDHHKRALNKGRTEDAVDVLIVGRGGGSTEDLWAFNQEEVARAIRGSVIPVISAVGHETDFTIADFVADKRAATPSAAAELVAAQEDQICASLEELGNQLTRLMKYKIVSSRARVQQQALSHAFDEVRERLRDARIDTRAATHELQLLTQQRIGAARVRAEAMKQTLSLSQLEMLVARARTRFEATEHASNAAISARLDAARQKLGITAASLDALSPLAVLERGYAIAQTADGQLLRTARSVSVGDSVRVRLAKGKLKTRVESIED